MFIWKYFGGFSFQTQNVFLKTTAPPHPSPSFAVINDRSLTANCCKISCRKKAHHIRLTNLFTSLAQLNGHGTSFKPHVVWMWLSSSALLNVKPHGHNTSAIEQFALWASSSLRLTIALHCLQGLSISSQYSMWSFALFSLTFLLHHLHSPSTMLRKLFARRFLHHPETGSRQLSHLITLPAYLDLILFTHHSQKLWPHGVATWASSKGFLL